MGIVARQSVWNTFILYSGVIVGFVNSVFLYPVILSKAEWGVVGTIISIAVILAQVGGMGGSISLIKYLPVYRSGNTNNGLLRFAFILSIIGIAIVTLALFFAKDLVLLPYSDEPLVDRYYHFIPAMIAGMVLFEIMAGYLNSIFRTSLQLFFREIVLRLAQSVFLGLFYFGFIGFDEFLIGYVCTYFLNVILLAVFLIFSGNFDIRSGGALSKWKARKEIIQYGGFTMLSGLANNLSNRMDILMVGALVGVSVGVDSANKGLEAAASYMLAGNIAMVLDMPLRAIGQIAHPVISNSWKKNDLENIRNLYRESSLTLLIVGGLLFIGIWANMDSLISLLPNNYHDIKWVFFFLGLSKLFNIAAGVNNHIMVTSVYYRYTTYFVLILAVLLFISNWLFIPEYGLVGAALATAISMVIYNSASMLFLFVKYRMSPFTEKSLYVTILIVGVGFIGYYLPALSSVWGDLLVRSVVICVIYVALIRFFNLSGNVNKMLSRVFGIFGIRI